MSKCEFWIHGDTIFNLKAWDTITREGDRIIYFSKDTGSGPSRFPVHFATTELRDLSWGYLVDITANNVSYG